MNLNDRVGRCYHSTMRALPIAVATLASITPMVGAPPMAWARDGAPAVDVEFDAARRQGVAYMRRKMWPLAHLEFAKARGLPGGRKDFTTRFGLAKAAWELLIVEEAVKEARVAVGLADPERPKDKAKAEALRDRIEEFFSGVTVVQDPRQQGQVTRGIIHLEVVGGLINRKKKERFARIRERFAQTPVRLPATIWLPFGEYKANGAPFSIRHGETAEAVTFLFLPDSERAASRWWWWVGGGVAAAGLATAAAVLMLAGEEPEERRVEIDGLTFGPPP